MGELDEPPCTAPCKGAVFYRTGTYRIPDPSGYYGAPQSTHKVQGWHSRYDPLNALAACPLMTSTVPSTSFILFISFYMAAGRISAQVLHTKIATTVGRLRPPFCLFSLRSRATRARFRRLIQDDDSHTSIFISVFLSRLVRIEHIMGDRTSLIGNFDTYTHIYIYIYK